MFTTTDYYVAAEVDYRRDRIAADFAGSAARRTRRRARREQRHRRFAQPQETAPGGLG